MVTARTDKAAAFPYKFIDGLTRVQQEQIYEDLLYLARSGSGTRWGTVVIAPSDATIASKDKSDLVLDGSSDTAKVNAAIAAITNRNLSGRVVFLEGTVYLTSPISITHTGYLKIEGQGRSTLLVATGDGIDVNNGTLEISNLRMTTGAIGISGTNENIYASNLDISGGTRGIIVGAASTVNGAVKDCTISATARGIQMNAISTGVVIGNTVTGLSSTGRGIDLQASNGFASQTTVADNYVTGSSADTGINLSNGSADATDVLNTVVVGNRVIGTFGIGIAFNGNNGTLVADNFISGCGAGIAVAAVGIVNCDNVLITGNYVRSSTGTAAIDIKNTTLTTSDVAVLFNKISGTTPTYAVRVGAGCSNCAVAFNDTFQGFATAALSDSGTATRTESDIIGATLNSNARVGVRKNSAGSTFLRRRLNLIEGTDLTITAADDSVDEEVDITLGLSATVNSNARVGVRKNSAGSTFLRRRLNLIEGGGITLTVSDDSGDEEVDVTIATSGGGSGVVSDIYVNGVLIGTRSIVEFLNGANFTVSGTDTGTRVQVTGAASVTGVAGLSMFNHLGLG